MNSYQRQQQVLGILQKSGVFLTGHFVLTSGRHSVIYMYKQMLDEETALRLCRLIVVKFIDHDIEVVVGPAEGGRRLAKYAAQHLSELEEREIPWLCAEKGSESGTFSIDRRHIAMVRGKHVFVIDDTGTTGSSVRGVVELVQKHGGHVTGVGLICNRGGLTEQDVGDVPRLVALVGVPFESWEEDKCPLCIEGIIPVDPNIGKGAEYLVRKQQEFCNS